MYVGFLYNRLSSLAFFIKAVKKVFLYLASTQKASPTDREMFLSKTCLEFTRKNHDLYTVLLRIKMWQILHDTLVYPI